VLIVDDEPLARRRLRELIGEAEGFEVADECEDGPSAVAAIDSGEFDLVLLDVQMPGMSGLEVVRTLGPERMPPVVFVTAYDEYAVEAFEVAALDYLLKPYDRARLLAALERARQSGRTADAVGRLAALLERQAQEPVERLVLRTGRRVLVVEPAEVDYVEAAGNYLRFHVNEDVHLVRGTLKAMEARLRPLGFLRVQRSLLVNAAAIREVRPNGDGEPRLLLRTGRELATGRAYREELRTFLER